LVEWGILGCLLWAGIFFGGMFRLGSRIFKAARDATRKPRSGGDKTPSTATPVLLDTAILLSLIGVAIHATFDFPLQIASIQLTTAALLGAAWRQGA
jgi:hypothetical protein